MPEDFDVFLDDNPDIDDEIQEYIDRNFNDEVIDYEEDW